MKTFVRNALLGAAGLVALTLSANAAGTTTAGDTPLAKSTTATSPMQMAQRPYDPSAGSVGFRNENPGGVGYKKAKKKKAKKKAKKK
jgi:hypothetical protein